MASRERTLEILWARAGDCCSICRCELLLPSAAGAPEGRTGEGGRSEALAVAEPGRVLRFPGAAEDRYDNLIVLCGPHHSLAGTQTNRFTAGELRRLKTEHEGWVRESLAPRRAVAGHERYDPVYRGVSLLARIHDGDALVGLLGGVHSIQADQDRPLTEGEQRLLESFMGYLKGVVDLWRHYDPEERRRVARHLQRQLSALTRGGLLACGGRYDVRASLGGVVGRWEILRILVLREGLPAAG